MFRGSSAWFSHSVRPELRDFWVAEGGEITRQAAAAEFLFSSDASHPDTQSIHQSLDYLEDQIAIFHSCYLTAIANSEMKTTVPLGHFLLPPACLQQEIRKKIGSFIWEQLTDPLSPQPSQLVEVKYRKEREELTCNGGSSQHQPQPQQPAPAPAWCPRAFTVEEKEALSPGGSHEITESPTMKMPGKGQQTAGSSERGKFACVPLQDYPASNMVTGYASAKDMKRFIGELRDFTPGCSGYLAYWIRNDTDKISHMKPKLKRKL